MSYLDLIGINVEQYEKEMATESFIDEYFDMISTESILDFGHYSLESAIGGSNFGNKFMYYFSKLGNIFTKRQAGFNQAISQMQNIDVSNINRGSSVIGLNVETANEYARITNAFNPQINSKKTARWQTLMNDMDAMMEDAAYEPLRQWWQGFKERVYAALSFATVILFPLGIYFWFKSIISEIRFYVAIWHWTTNKAQKDVMLAKGIELINAIVAELTQNIYFTVCPDNPARLSRDFGSMDMIKATNAIVQKLRDLKINIARKLPVEYEEKCKAAEIVYEAAATVYKEKLHMVSPGAVKAMNSGAEALTDKVFRSVEGYNDLKLAMDAYKGLMVAAELYFDITNKVLIDLYKM